MPTRATHEYFGRLSGLVTGVGLYYLHAKGNPVSSPFFNGFPDGELWAVAAFLIMGTVIGIISLYSTFPDLLKPPRSPHHRALFHSRLLLLALPAIALLIFFGVLRIQDFLAEIRRDFRHRGLLELFGSGLFTPYGLPRLQVSTRIITGTWKAHEEHRTTMGSRARIRCDDRGFGFRRAGDGHRKCTRATAGDVLPATP